MPYKTPAELASAMRYQSDLETGKKYRSVINDIVPELMSEGNPAHDLHESLRTLAKWDEKVDKDHLKAAARKGIAQVNRAVRSALEKRQEDIAAIADGQTPPDLTPLINRQFYTTAAQRLFEDVFKRDASVRKLESHPDVVRLNASNLKTEELKKRIAETEDSDIEGHAALVTMLSARQSRSNMLRGLTVTFQLMPPSVQLSERVLQTMQQQMALYDYPICNDPRIVALLPPGASPVRLLPHTSRLEEAFYVAAQRTVPQMLQTRTMQAWLAANFFQESDVPADRHSDRRARIGEICNHFFPEGPPWREGVAGDYAVPQNALCAPMFGP